LDQPQNDIAAALPRSTHGPETVGSAFLPLAPRALFVVPKAGVSAGGIVARRVEIRVDVTSSTEPKNAIACSVSVWVTTPTVRSDRPKLLTIALTSRASDAHLNPYPA